MMDPYETFTGSDGQRVVERTQPRQFLALLVITVATRKCWAWL